jgi:LmbE family N-acetylglucosaminyl deacetylase
MRNNRRFASPGRARIALWLAAYVSAAWLGLAPGWKLAAHPQASPQAVTDRITYNIGEQVMVRIVFSSEPAAPTRARYLFTVRYAGEAKSVAKGSLPGGAEGPSSGYGLLWKVPLDARAGRYDGDMSAEDVGQQGALNIPRICSFVVHRQTIRMDSAEVAQLYYTTGDAIGCSVKIENLSGQPLSGLRLEFSERYWPWIVQQRQRVGSDIEKLRDDIALKPHQRTAVNAGRCAVATNVHEPTIKQYAAVLWDHDRKNVLAIAVTPLVFINPPGLAAPHPYPLQYVYPDLAAVNTTSYRNFHPAPFGAAAIRFETQNTMFASGSEAKVRFTLVNPSDAPWRQVSVRARLLGPDGKEVANQTIVDRADLDSHGPALSQEVGFTLPPDASGLYRVRVDLSAASGPILASNELELGINPLPKSVLMFCAHEDDDGTQMGFIRALVENQIPFHLVYYTSGDAGSCDRYFQHTCGPAEALNFGAIRMQEARAAMGHLGVPPENISFLGLPDGGTGKIWYNHWRSSDPYLAVLLASDHAPYDGLFRPNLAYSRNAVVEAAEEIIKKFQPEVVFTNHPPAEGHIDHIVNNYFTVKALQELLRAGAISTDLEVRVDGIFDPKGYPATPYRYEDHQFYLSGEAMTLVQEAGWFYQSQGGNRGEGNLRTWNQLRRSEPYRKVLDWKEHEGWNEKE